MVRPTDLSCFTTARRNVAHIIADGMTLCGRRIAPEQRKATDHNTALCRNCMAVKDSQDIYGPRQERSAARRRLHALAALIR